MDSVVKVLLAVGVSVGVFGALFIQRGRTGRGRLPGDMIIRPGDFVFYSPLGLSIALSVALATLSLYLRR
jgi:Protein of unknown function (DUF2905)